MIASIMKQVVKLLLMTQIIQTKPCIATFIFKFMCDFLLPIIVSISKKLLFETIFENKLIFIQKFIE